MLKNLKINKISKVSKMRDSSFIAHSFLSMPFFQIVFFFPNERVSVIPANPYFLSKIAEQDVTLTLLTADLS